MACLNNPAPGFPVGVSGLLVDLLTTGADVWNELLGDDPWLDRRIVIALVQAQSLGCLGRRDRPGDRDRLKRRSQQLVIVAVRAVDSYAERDTSGVADDRAFRPFLPRSVGFGPVLGPPKGALVIAPSTAKNDQSIPTVSSNSNRP